MLFFFVVVISHFAQKKKKHYERTWQIPELRCHIRYNYLIFDNLKPTCTESPAYVQRIVQQTITTLKILPITTMKLEGFLPMGGTPLAMWPGL